MMITVEEAKERICRWQKAETDERCSRQEDANLEDKLLQEVIELIDELNRDSRILRGKSR